MSDLNNYKEKVAKDVAAGVISPQLGNQMVQQATILANPNGDLGANHRYALRYGHLKTPPPRPPLPDVFIPTPQPQPNDPTPITFRPFRFRSPSYEAPPPPVPVVPTPPPAPEITKGVKQASPDIIVFDEDSIDPGFLIEAFFEEFGGTELINISRTDLINGDKVSYSPIVNLSEIYRKYNPNNIISIAQYQELPTKYGIDLLSREPEAPYFDENGDMVIEVGIVKDDESIEVEFALSGTINRIEQ